MRRWNCSQLVVSVSVLVYRFLLVTKEEDLTETNQSTNSIFHKIINYNILSKKLNIDYQKLVLYVRICKLLLNFTDPIKEDADACESIMN